MPDDRFTRAWKDGIAKQLSTRALECLLEGLRADDPALIQGRDYQPWGAWDSPVVACCAAVYGQWKAGKVRVGREFCDLIWTLYDAAKKATGEPLTLYHFTVCGWDDRPRAEAIAVLTPLVEQSLREREGV